MVCELPCHTDYEKAHVDYRKRHRFCDGLGHVRHWYVVEPPVRLAADFAILSDSFAGVGSAGSIA